MKILLICDKKSVDNQIGMYKALLGMLGKHDVEHITLSNAEILPCMGCFDCWLKTPGRCIITGDAANSIVAKIVAADAVILLSEITFGGFSADTKSLVDRIVQTCLPYFEIDNNEMHHVPRYDSFPAWIAIGYGDACEAEKQTFVRLAKRNALNFHPKSYFALAILDEQELARNGNAILEALEVTA